MDHTCQHCGGSIVGSAYRVTSEEAGITLLEMIVWSPALKRQKDFIFMQRKLILEANRLQLETERVTSTDLAFN
jgi:hypothetical protein